jgi:hypothetical protein
VKEVCFAVFKSMLNAKPQAREVYLLRPAHNPEPNLCGLGASGLSVVTLHQGKMSTVRVERTGHMDRFDDGADRRSVAMKVRVDCAGR